MALIWECWAVGLAASSSLSDTEAVIFHQEEVAAVLGHAFVACLPAGSERETPVLQSVAGV
uniref:Uncharacterized protein n=1 Tax=Anguilla anguilla TaxID=7936 RepID=A0A0E9PR02_ANGAN